MRTRLHVSSMLPSIKQHRNQNMMTIARNYCCVRARGVTVILWSLWLYFSVGNTE